MRFAGCGLQIAITPPWPERGWCGDAARQLHSDIFIAPHKDQLLLQAFTGKLLFFFLRLVVILFRGMCRAKRDLVIFWCRETA